MCLHQPSTNGQGEERDGLEEGSESFWILNDEGDEEGDEATVWMSVKPKRRELGLTISSEEVGSLQPY